MAKSLKYLSIKFIVEKRIKYKDKLILPEFELILDDLIKINKIYRLHELSDYDLCINGYLKGYELLIYFL